MANLFVSHSSADSEESQRLGEWLMERGHSVFLDFHHDAGIDPGLDWEQKLYDELRACQAVIVICTPNSMGSMWCFAEITHARSMGKHLFPLKFADCDVVGVLNDTQVLDFTKLEPADAWGRLERGLEVAGVTAGNPFQRNPQRPLYPGLFSYHAADSAIFFGRDAEISNGIDVLNRSHRFSGSGLILTLGGSGSGKSSLVRAGIVPRLELDTRSWLVIDPFRPGNDPHGNLVAAIASTMKRYEHQLDRPTHSIAELSAALIGQAEPATFASMQNDEPGMHAQTLGHLIAAMETLLKNPPLGTEEGNMQRLRAGLKEWRRVRSELGEQKQRRPASIGGTPLSQIATQLLDDLGRDRDETRVLLVVDQFEELLNQGENHPAQDVLALLRATVEDHTSPVIVIGTMRSDYLAEFQSEPALIGQGFSEILVGPMSRSALRDVIIEPAALVGESFEPALVDHLLDDAGSRDTLPLLAFTLSKLYQEYSRQPAHAGVGSRVAPRKPMIEEIHYNSIGGLKGAVGTVAKELRLSRKLTPQQEADLQMTFVGHLARYNQQGKPVRRLAHWNDLPKGIHGVLEEFVEARLLVSESDDGERTLEVAHETLFSSWAELHEWLEANREFLLWRRRLVARLDEWKRVNRKGAALLSGPSLAEARSWYQRSRQLLDKEKDNFIRRSLARRRNQITVGAVIVLAVIAAISFSWRQAEVQRAQAEEQTARVIAVQAMTALQGNTELALLVALEAHHHAPTFESRSSLHSLLSANIQLEAILYRYGTLASAVKYSPDGQLLASGSDHNTVVVQHAVTGEVVQIVDDFSQSIKSVSFADNGNLLVAQTQDEVFAWKPGSPVTELNQIKASSKYTAMDAHPHRPLIALGLENGDVQLFEPGNTGSLRKRGPLASEVYTLAFDPDGERLISGHKNGAVQLWNVADRSPARQLLDASDRQAPVRSVAFSADGLRAASSEDSGHVRIYELASAPALKHSFNTHQGTVFALAFDRGGNLWSGGKDGTIRRWGTDGRSLGILGHAPGGIRSLDINEEAKTLVSTGFDGTVRVWNLGRPLHTFNLQQEGVNAVDFHVASALAASGGQRGTLRLWDLKHNKLHKELEDHNAIKAIKANIFSVAFSPNGQMLASGDEAGVVRVWSVKSGALLATRDYLENDKQEAVQSLAFSKDGAWLAVGYSDGQTRLFANSPLPKLMPIIFPKYKQRVRALAFGPNNHLAHGSGHVVRVFEIDASGGIAAPAPKANLLFEQDGHGRGVMSLAFNETGNTVFAGEAGGLIKAWKLNVPNQTPVQLIGHEGEVRGLAFDNGLLASASRDKTIRLWDVASGIQVDKRFELIGHQDKVNTVAFADGTLWSGSSDATMRLWSISLSDFDTEVCKRVRRSLTQDELIDHFGRESSGQPTCKGFSNPQQR